MLCWLPIAVPGHALIRSVHRHVDVEGQDTKVR